jgi:Flp pilus assembly protein TadG
LIIKLRSLPADTRGVGAVEFALIVPFMIAVWMGSVELATLELVSRKVSVAAQTVADLVAQEEKVTTDNLENIIGVARQILAPFSTETLSIQIISVEADVDGLINVGWSFPAGDGAVIPEKARGLLIQNESVVAVVLKYNAKGIFANYERNIIEEFYTRPRKVRIISFGTE